MKILIVIPSLHSGGAERVVSSLSQEWAKKHEVKILVFDASNQAYSYGGQLIQLDLPANTGFLRKSIQAIRRISQLAHQFQTEKPEQIITFMESTNFPSILAAMLTGRLSSLWVSVRNNPSTFPWYYRKLIPFMYRFPSRVVAVSKGISHALKELGVPQSKLLTIPNPAPANIPPLTSLLSKPANAPERYILGVGRLHWQKGFDRLIAAFAQVDDPGLHLVILGEGKERSKLQAQAKTLGISQRVYLPGTTKDVWSWYRYALCFVLSSRHEGWPNVLMEVISQECPPIAFNCKYGPSEIIENGVNGYLIQEGNIDELVKFLTDMPRIAAIKKSLAVAAGEFCSRMSVNKIAALWINNQSGV